MKIIAEEQDVEDFSDTAGVRFKFATDPPKFNVKHCVTDKDFQAWVCLKGYFIAIA